jgi:copper chaperone
MAVATVEVKGMSCAGCVHAVAHALQAVPGVRTVDVSLEAGRATVTFADGKVSMDDLKGAVEDAGYDVD